MAIEFREATTVDVPMRDGIAQVPVNGPTNTPTETEGSWMADFHAAFGDQSADNGGTPKAETPATPAAAQPSTPAAESKPTVVAPDPATVERQVEARAQAVLAQQRAQADQAAYNDWLNTLSPAEYGAHMREQQMISAIEARGRVQAMNMFVQQGAQKLVEQVRELGQLTPEEAAKVDYTKAADYGEWARSVVDVVSDRKAATKATKATEQDRERIRLEELDKLRREYPKQPFNVGGEPAGNLLPFESSSAMEMMRAAFQEK